MYNINMIILCRYSFYDSRESSKKKNIVFYWWFIINYLYYFIFIFIYLFETHTIITSPLVWLHSSVNTRFTSNIIVSVIAVVVVVTERVFGNYTWQEFNWAKAFWTFTWKLGEYNLMMNEICTKSTRLKYIIHYVSR